MEILLDGRLISNKPTGISRYSLEVIKIYQKKYGAENVSVLVNNHYDNSFFNEIVTAYKPFNILHFIIFSFYLSKINFDVYHTLFYSNSLFKVKSKKYITTVHDMMYANVKTFFGNNPIISFLKRIYIDIIVYFTLKNSDHIISVSETTRDDVKNRFGYDSDFIPEGINKIKNENEYNVATLGLVEGDYFIYVGNSRPHKNLEFLISAFNNSKTKKKLVLCGNNNGVKVNNNKIISLGFVDDNQLYALYKKSAAFIFPSLYEGFGLPVLEALHIGTKVLSSNGGALKEFPKEVVTYFDPNCEESLINLLENIDNIQIDTSIKRSVLDKYDWNNTNKVMNMTLNKWGII